MSGFVRAIKGEGTRNLLRRPAETVQAIDGTIAGVIVVIVGWVKGGDLAVPLTVIGAVMILLAYVAAFVTWVWARRQRAGVRGSASDGSVT